MSRTLSGTVVLQAVVRSDGTVDVLRVVRGLPLGLPDSAIDAINQWQFKPGQKDGQNADHRSEHRSKFQHC